MQITTMPTTALFKTKWSIFMTKLSPATHEHVHNQQRRRRSSSSSTEEDTKNGQKRRKHSDAMSVGTFESTVSMADKFRQAIPFFRRRSSSNISNVEEQPQPIQQKEVSSTPCTTQVQTIVSHEYCKQLERLQSLYTLAVDELNYAEDSQGSSYYSGDLDTAREALDDCANAFIQLLSQTTDVLTREGLQSSMAPKLLKLQKRINALPEADDTTNVYC